MLLLMTMMMVVVTHEVAEQGFQISNTGLLALLIFFLLIVCFLNTVTNHKSLFPLKLLVFALYRY